MDLVALKAELDAGHPVTGAYNANTDLAAAEINAVNRTKIRASMSGSELLAATDATEYDAKTDAQKSQWLSLCAVGSIDPANGKLAASIVQSVFGGGSATQTALVAARDENISRATELGFGRVLGVHIEDARAL